MPEIYNDPKYAIGFLKWDEDNGLKKIIEYIWRFQQNINI